jgi:hypothetical protein
LRCGSGVESAQLISGNSHRAISRTAAGKVALLAAICLLVGLAVAAGQKPAASTVRGFQAPLEYFEAPHELQVKSFLEGTEAEPGADGVILIRNAKLQTFREDGGKEMTVKAPECIFDSRQHTVSSAGPLRVQTSDDKLLLEGVGFFWQQTNSDLIISNQVRTTVRGSLTNTFIP